VKHLKARPPKSAENKNIRRPKEKHPVNATPPNPQKDELRENETQQSPDRKKEKERLTPYRGGEKGESKFL